MNVYIYIYEHIMVVQKRKQMSSYGIHVSKHVCNANLQVCQPLSSRIYKNRQKTQIFYKSADTNFSTRKDLPSFNTKNRCSSGVSTVLPSHWGVFRCSRHSLPSSFNICRQRLMVVEKATATTKKERSKKVVVENHLKKYSSNWTYSSTIFG